MSTPSPLAAQMAANENSGGVGQLILLLVVLIALLIGVYYATKYVARYAQRGTLFSGRRSAGKGRSPEMGSHIHLVDRFALDRERCIVLFDCDGRRFLAGVTAEQFVLLKETEVPPAQTEPEDGEPVSSVSFRDMLSGRKAEKEDKEP